jgi:DNA-binding response OmpR family regulator
MDQIIEQSLAGKRFGLMGFEPAEADSIIAVLKTVRGIGSVVGWAPNVPGLNSLSRFDACIINTSAIGSREQPAPIETIARSRRPALIIGTLEELMMHSDAVTDLNRDFVVRPFKPEELLLRASRILRFAETAELEIQSSTRNSMRHILLADDDATTIIMISAILKHFGFECEIAHDGVQALDIARKKKPDLVLLDVSMPKMNGFEALAALRKDSATRDMPVVLVSAHRDETDVVKGFSLGANDYITKPFTPGELMARINRVLQESVEN